MLSGKHLGLENLYRMVMHEPERGVELVENYLDRLIEGDSLSAMPLPLSVAKPRIMPRIQPLSIFDHLDREHSIKKRCDINSVDVFLRFQRSVHVRKNRRVEIHPDRWNIANASIDIRASDD